ncbi:MAG: hypothetical protein M3Z85_20100 [Acidobacteriota bacterium]|nr:hypothetical protein [Acidobacteriota bacterium]
MSDVNYHPTEDHLESYAMSRLPEADLEILEEHLLLCEGCQLRLDGTETYIAAMKTALREAEREPATVGERLRSWMSDLQPAFSPAWAGAFAVVAVLIGVSATQLTVSNKPVEPLMVRLEAMKGDADAAVANRPLALVLDSRGLPASTQYRLLIVNQIGKKVWEAAAVPGDVSLQALVKKPLGAGQYFVRVYGQGQEPLREYGLHVR